jgi:hypothetical protein
MWCVEMCGCANFLGWLGFVCGCSVLFGGYGVLPTGGVGPGVWSCACKSNISVIQRCQLKIFRAVFDAPRYVTNDMIHKDLGIPAVQEVIHERSIKHRTKLKSHSNPLLQRLPRDNVIRRRKRRWPADL